MAENGTYKPTKKIFLWAHPRSLTTVFVKCIGCMDGSQIWYEPYVSCYFNSVFKDPEALQLFPGMKATLGQFMKAQELVNAGGHPYAGGNLSPAENFNYDWVKKQLEKPVEEGKDFMFIKDGPICIDGVYDKLPQGEFKHTFIIRPPKRQALSLRTALMHMSEYTGEPDEFPLGPGTHPFISLKKVFKDCLYNFWRYVRENIDPNPIVIDTDDLQNHPEQILRKYCEAVGIPFKKEYLSWNKSDEIVKYFHGSLEQFVWGMNEHVYDAAILSSCFLPLKSKIPDSIPPNCVEYESEVMEGYKAMYETRIKPE